MKTGSRVHDMKNTTELFCGDDDVVKDVVIKDIIVYVG